MNGSPLYPADYKHFDYVNPDAPKGGDMKTSVSGSFDSLNNHVILGNHGEGLELLNDKLMERAWNEPFTMYGLGRRRASMSRRTGHGLSSTSTRKRASTTACR